MAVVFCAYAYLRPPSGIGGHHAYRTWAYAHLAYSDIAALYLSHSLSNHALPYIQTPIEYPVLTGVFMWMAAFFGGFQGYFLASAIGMAICAASISGLLGTMSRRAAWLFSASPLLLVYSLLNWDLLAIFFMVAGIYFFRRRSYLASGVLFSLGTSAKLFPVLALLFFGLELYHQRQRTGGQVGLSRFLSGAIVAGVLVNLPFVLLNFRGWFYFFSFNYFRSGGGGILGSIRALKHLPVLQVDFVVAALLIGGLLWVGRQQLRGLGPEQATAAAMAAFMILNKTYSPQYVLWISTLGLIAQWPDWIFVALSVMGISDYASAFTTMHLEQSRSRQLAWYVSVVGQKFLYVRLGTIACGLLPVLSRRQSSDPTGANRGAPAVERIS